MVESRKVLSVLVLAIILLSCAIIWFYPPTGDYRVDNPSWNGFSKLNSETAAVSLGALEDLPSAGTGTALVLVPYEQISDQEISKLSSYVNSGGTVVVMDDFGFGNQVLSGLGLQARFSGQSLLDPLFNYKNKWFPEISDFTPTPQNVTVDSIVLNHATYLSNSKGMEVVAYSSKFSFVDANGDETWESNETTGALPVAAYTQLGAGFVVAVSDPSIAINGMIGLGDNLQFINKVLSIHGENSVVYIDQSHLPSTALDETKAGLSFVYGLVASPLGTLSLIVVVLAISLKSFLARRQSNENKSRIL